MSILAHDWFGAFHLYAGFLPPLQGLLGGTCDPGAAARVSARLAPGYSLSPLPGLRIFWGGMVFGLTESRMVDVLAGS